MISFIADTAQLSLQNVSNHHLGYYQVGNKIFRNRISAILESSSNPCHQVTWHFNDDTFSLHDWTKEPLSDVEELYKIRAWQLRNNYDYLVLQWSGGSDSTNILTTFLKNKIKLNEILIHWPRAITKNLYSPCNTNFSSDNWWSEWDFVIVPGIKWIMSNYPEIKITIDDWSDVAINYTTNAKDDWCLDRNLLSPLAHHRFKNLDKIFDKHKKTAIINGLDKPRLMYKQDTYYCYFVDTANVIQHVIYLPWIENLDVKRELFYWSPDCVHLIIKQCHILKRFFSSHPEFLPLISPHSIKSKCNTEEYHDLCKPLLYPGWHPVFQVGKNFSKEGWDTGLTHLYPKKFMEMYDSGHRDLMSEIDQRYYDNDTKNIIGFVSGIYKI